MKEFLLQQIWKTEPKSLIFLLLSFVVSSILMYGLFNKAIAIIVSSMMIVVIDVVYSVILVLGFNKLPITAMNISIAGLESIFALIIGIGLLTFYKPKTKSSRVDRRYKTNYSYLGDVFYLTILAIFPFCFYCLISGNIWNSQILWLNLLNLLA